MASSTLLREAIAAVKAGQRQYAKELLLELVEVEPTNELAWVWLSGLLESREEQIIALENSITISKGGPGLEDRLLGLDQAKVGPEVELYKSALGALDKGDRGRAKLLLEKVVAVNNDHERAWITLANLAADDEEMATALQNVVRINPNNFKARESLTTTQHTLYQRFVNRARQLEQEGDFQLAIQAYRSAERYAASGSFREAVRQRRQIAEGRTTEVETSASNTGSLVLLSGPFLLYLVLVFLGSGGQIERLSPLYLYFLGAVSVLLGSVLLLLSGLSKQTAWRWKAGTASSPRRWLLRIVGSILLLLPFGFWLLTLPAS